MTTTREKVVKLGLIFRHTLLLTAVFNTSIAMQKYSVSYIEVYNIITMILFFLRQINDLMTLFGIG